MQEKYITSPSLEEAIKVAEVTQRPLLLKGEPGTGKTLLAEHYANKNNLPLYRWHIKSTTIAKDGLYFYDAVSRLNDSRFNDGSKDVNNIENYIRLEAMGQSFENTEKSVLLIDEIDKADIEFPNDLLLELDRMEFTILETGREVKAQTRPLVIITSNNEKELPDAFLRRCIFHYIEFPDEKMMQEIVHAHYPDIDKKLMKSALEMFYSLRDIDSLRKKPSTSELVDWLNILIYQGGKVSSKDIPYIGSLIKNEDDLKRFK
jgi:MoxR-like ATPase